MKKIDGRCGDDDDAMMMKELKVKKRKKKTEQRKRRTVRKSNRRIPNTSVGQQSIRAERPLRKIWVEEHDRLRVEEDRVDLVVAAGRLLTAGGHLEGPQKAADHQLQLLQVLLLRLDHAKDELGINTKSPNHNLPISLSHILRMRTVMYSLTMLFHRRRQSQPRKKDCNLLDLLNVLRLQLIVSAVGVRVAALAVGPGAAGSASSSSAAAAAAIEASQPPPRPSRLARALGVRRHSRFSVQS
ncbi:hypothetical protein TYRP_013342 [Tyrophagus putrescentiae]|nr:hypothetical protein TYRP_013342 [Tyrophagus putrescentiae]